MPVSLIPYNPNPDGSCRNCRSALNPETWLCVRCGTAHGEKNRCPHCRTVARTVPHTALWHRCSVCGKPRVPPGPSAGTNNPTVNQTLLQAGQSNRAATILKLLSYSLFGLGTFTEIGTLLFLWVSEPQRLTSLIALAFASLPLLLAIFARFSASQSVRQRDKALLFAYSEHVIGTLEQLDRSVEAKQIAGWLGLSVPTTETLLTKLNTDDRMRSDITDEGEVVYGALGTARVRLESPPPTRVAVPSNAGPVETHTSTAASDVALTPSDVSEPNDLVDAEFEEADSSASKRQQRP